jgi:dihydrofolate reductase
MAKLRVHNFAISLDGYGAGPDQGLENPLGVGGERLHEWIFETKFGREMIGERGGEEGIDQDFLVAGFTGIGPWIMGRNMFGPIRGDWGDSDWRGWWGENPPYHHSVFVLTHHPHDPIEMDGGTTFYFVTDGIESALEQATAAADGGDIRLGGGAATIQEYLRVGLVDDLHVAVVPLLLGRGERLFEHLDGAVEGYECAELVASKSVVHVRMVPKR